MNDKIVSVIRTAVPAGVGYLLALLISAIPAVGEGIAWIDSQIDAALPGDSGVTVLGLLQAAAVALVVAGYYAVARWCGQHWPAAERLLLGSAKTPVYTMPESSPVPLPGETREQYRARTGQEHPATEALS